MYGEKTGNREYCVVVSARPVILMLMPTNLKVDPCSLQNSGSGKSQRGATFIDTIRSMGRMHRSFVKLLAQVSSIQLDAAAAELFGPWVVNNHYM